jgi:molybdenum cofactor synthesis domain-containing protein
MDRTAAALIIGNELLSGKVQEQNLIVLARTLRELGIELSRVVMVSDEVESIAREVSALAAAHDQVFTSGGIGPTHDDVTIEAVARAFGVPVVPHPRLESMLRDYYRERCSDCHLRMALLPEGAELIASEEVRWPSIVMRNVWILPGIPEVFRMKMPLLGLRLGGGIPFRSRTVYTKLDEGDLKPLLDRVVAGHPAVAVGSYPKWQDPAYKTKLTFDGRDEQAISAAVKEFLSLLPGGEPQRVE